ncbi:MAG: metallopeptidase family protein [Deltaproteobacteria bacterium]|nr:metallopeptidase family protein [Deltaproteobacteria bacterium]
MPRGNERNDVDGAMERVLRRLDAHDLDGARREVDRMAERHGTSPEVLYVRGLLRLEEEDEERAVELLTQAFRQDPTLVDAGLTALDLLDDDDPGKVADLGDRLRAAELTVEERADVVYRAAVAREAMHEEDAARELFVEVWELDRRRRRRRGVPHVSVQKFGRMVQEAIAQLPDPIRLRIEHVPIIVQDRPDREVVEQGFDPRSLGMFDGVPYADQGPPTLTRILVFQRNVEDCVENESELEDEVYVTLLHETGHFFGLSEEDLALRGLA